MVIDYLRHHYLILSRYLIDWYVWISPPTACFDRGKNVSSVFRRLLRALRISRFSHPALPGVYARVSGAPVRPEYTECGQHRGLRAGASGDTTHVPVSLRSVGIDADCKAHLFPSGVEECKEVHA